MRQALVRVRFNRNLCPFDDKENEKKPKHGLPPHILVYSGPATSIEWDSRTDCPGPFWRVHEASVKAAFGNYYDSCPPVYVCGHQIDVD